MPEADKKRAGWSHHSPPNGGSSVTDVALPIREATSSNLCANGNPWSKPRSRLLRCKARAKAPAVRRNEDFRHGLCCSSLVALELRGMQCELRIRFEH